MFRSAWGLAMVAALAWPAMEAAQREAQGAESAASLPTADVEELDATSAAHLAHAERLLAAEQWSEAVEAIRRAQEHGAERLIRVELSWPADDFERYVPVGEYCQWRMAQLATEAPQALAHYRSLVDPLAERWLREGEQNNDEEPLQRVVQQAFASSHADEALLKLGDLALARGEYAAARAAWQRIRPALGAEAGPATAGVYPDSDLDPAAVQARLVLASVLENSRGRAASELATLREHYPLAEGFLGGVKGRYADRLQSILEDSADWPAARKPADWVTFGGDLQRGRVATREIDPAGRPLWTFPLPRQAVGESADDGGAGLSYHPVVVGQTALIKFDSHDGSQVVALDLKTGQRLWNAEQSGNSRDGAADCHTLSVTGNKVFARAGSPATSSSIRREADSTIDEQGVLVGLDMVKHGEPLAGFPIFPPGPEWAFEGTPLSDGNAVYVAMRRAGSGQSQLHVAAFELQSALGKPPDNAANSRSTGRLKWRTRICSGRSGRDEDHCSHLLLTLDSGRIYFNTSAGAIAAVRASDGRLLWLLKYPRLAVGKGASDRAGQRGHRDLAPCLAAKDLVIVAPADCRQIFAADAATGQLAWALPAGVAADAIHLLGVQNDVLLASGDALYWIDAQTGQLLTQYPRGRPGGPAQAVPAPRGFGRGVLAGENVWWPTRESLFVFAARPENTEFGRQPRMIREIPLVTRGITGGNLVLPGGVLLIAGADRLVAVGE